MMSGAVEGGSKQALTRGNITLNETIWSVTVKGEPVDLSQAQIAPLSTSMRHPNQVINREQLIELTFRHKFDGFDRAIDSQIARLRKRISRHGSQPIQTVSGAGYKSCNRLIHAEAGNLVEVAVSYLEDLHTACAALAHGVAHE